MFCSCKESNRGRIARLVKEWEGKEVILPDNIVFTQYGIDTLDYQLPESDYTIVSYIDSVGCTSCKLQFHRWQQIIHEMDSISEQGILFLFVFHPKGTRGVSEVGYLMKRDKFDYPVWIDRDDEYNKMNKLPEESMFHTMLIDRQHKVLAMGNPFQNPKIKELYLNIISGDANKPGSSSSITELAAEQSVIDLGEFDWETPQKAIFRLNNTGENRLVINDVVASCGCISLDYLKNPIEAGKEVLIQVTYKAEKPEFFNKKLTVYANSKIPLQLIIKGHAN